MLKLLHQLFKNSIMLKTVILSLLEVFVFIMSKTALSLLCPIIRFFQY